MARNSLKERLFKTGKIASVGALALETVRGVLAPQSAGAHADSERKLREALLPQSSHTQHMSDDELGEMNPDRSRLHFPDTQQPGAFDSPAMPEHLQQQENTPAVVPEFRLTENDMVALEAYFEQQYGVSVERAIGEEGYVVFDLDIAADGSLPITFDTSGPLGRQVEVVLNAVNQVDPHHTAIGLQMNLAVRDGQSSLGFAIVYREQIGLRTPGNQEYLGADNQFAYLAGVRDDTEVVLFRVDPATSEQTGHLALIENGISTPVGAPQVGTLMLLERYPDDYPDESKRGAVVSFILGDRALVVASELPEDQPDGQPEVTGGPVATPPVNRISLASFSPGEEEDTSEIWERYGVSREVYLRVLSRYPGHILNRLALPEGDPDRMTYSAQYGTVVDSEGCAWFPKIAPAGSPESESYVTLMDTFVDAENNITYNLFMNPEAYSDRRTAQVNASQASWSEIFETNVVAVDAEKLSQWSDEGITINVVLMANWNSGMRLEVPHLISSPTGEMAMALKQNGNAFTLQAFIGFGSPGDFDLHGKQLRSIVGAGIKLISDASPTTPFLSGGDYVNGIYDGRWSNEARVIIESLAYDPQGTSWPAIIFSE